ncbi:MAG TPA: hypothetical protein VF172_07710 [Nitrososphaera sp.]
MSNARCDTGGERHACQDVSSDKNRSPGAIVNAAEINLACERSCGTPGGEENKTLKITGGSKNKAVQEFFNCYAEHEEEEISE